MYLWFHYSYKVLKKIKKKTNQNKKQINTVLYVQLVKTTVQLWSGHNESSLMYQ